MKLVEKKIEEERKMRKEAANNKTVSQSKKLIG